MSRIWAAIALTVVGTITTMAGAALYILPGPWIPVLAVGMAMLVAGVLMLGLDADCREPAFPRRYVTKNLGRPGDAAGGACRYRISWSSASGRPRSPIGSGRHRAFRLAVPSAAESCPAPPLTCSAISPPQLRGSASYWRRTPCHPSIVRRVR